MKKLLIIILSVFITISFGKVKFGFLNDWFSSDNDNDYCTVEMEKEIEISKGTHLYLKNQNGYVKIESWNEDKVKVDVTMKSRKGEDELNKVQIMAELNGDDLEIVTKRLKRDAKVTVNYTIYAPSYLIIDNIKSSNGSITIEDMKGDMRVSTSNGSIVFKNIDGNIVGESSNGTIKAINCSSIDKLDTSNGSIYAEIKEVKNNISLDTSNGSITIKVNENLDLDLELDTSNGKVSIEDLNLDVRKKKRTYFRGSLNNGGYLIKGDTSNGSIKLSSL
ncbi:MAG: hypothetical protein CR982_02025 [Candidatus Cloacimonadota bacterium]|nr:MAG: hypothetical protein CR982_02025 [Candidatus Cloacimonadota bacterium]PIE78938.1 MAG: hypothetical protein CSA15_05165 [Candidatus Delongbacteria bacterium]